METATDKYIRQLKERKEKFRKVTTICPIHTGNYKQKVIITKDRMFFSCCYCEYIRSNREIHEMKSVLK